MQKDDYPRRFYKKLFIGWAILILAVVIVLIVRDVRQSIKYHVPKYAKASAIEKAFGDEVSGLKKEALSCIKPRSLSPDDKKYWNELFSRPAILGAEIMFLEADGAGGYHYTLKDYEDSLNLGKTGVYHSPKAGRAVVQRYISDEREVVVYEAIVGDSPRRKIKLIFDLDELKAAA